MPDEQKQNNLSINQDDDRPSRFMVDLNKIAQEQAGERKQQVKFFKPFLNYFSQDENKKGVSAGKARDIIDSYRPRLKKLAFFPIIKIFYFLCYRVGWLAVFFARFVYFLLKRTVQVFKKKKTEHKIKPGPASVEEKFEFAPARSKLNNGLARDNLKDAAAADEIYLEDEPIEAYRKKILRKTDAWTDANNLISRGYDEPGPKQDWEHKIEKALAKKPKLEKQRFFRGFWPKIYLGRLQPVVSFALVLIILSVPLKVFTSYRILSDFRGQVLGVSEAAIGDLKNASISAANSDFNAARDSFVAASNKFSEVKNKTNEISAILNILSPLIPNDNIKLAAEGGYILEAGRQAANLGSELTAVFSGLGEDNKWDTIEFMNSLQIHIENASRIANELNRQINKIDPTSLPKDYQIKFFELKKLSSITKQSLLELSDIAFCARNIFGFDRDSRYLLVFQNNSELRASGGFIGSYALVDFHNGNIKKMEVPGGGSYDTEGGLTERIVSPEPLHLVNPLWHFWDANWWPDWPTTAKKLMWFYEKSGGPTVDGVIGITPTVMERILSIIGPIDMRENYDVIITADNFWETAQKFAETKPALCSESQVLSGADGCVSTSSAPRHEPKKIIGDLMDKVIKEFPQRLDKEKILALIMMLEGGLGEKHILLYFNNEELEKKISSFGWDGRIKHSPWDYLMVVNTNIAGAKTDRVIKEEIDHTADVSPDGSVINTLKITRSHKGIKGEPFIGVRNVDWVRIYVPLGSELIEASGFEKPDEKLFEKPDESWQNDPDVLKSENNKAIDVGSGTWIYSEAGKTVFANWSMVDPGESVVLYIKYRLPFKVDKKNKSGNAVGDNNAIPYAFLAQKQPGSLGSRITSRLELPNNLKISWKYPDELNTVKNSWYISDNLETDRFWAVLINPDNS